MTAPSNGEPTAATLAAGGRIGKYLLTEKLGEGGMGMVWAATHETLGRDVAIKFLRGEYAENQQLLARFQQEAMAVSRIGHGNIVAVYDFGRLADGTLYYVMERIRGETVTRRLRRPPPLTDDEIASLFGQMCRALQAAHAHAVVHRDLKPDNVLLSPQANGHPHVKIVDFGVAKMREHGTAAPGALTRSGTILGTPTYMAPEQITSPQSIDGRADQYALGAMLFEVLVGEPPFGRGDMLQTMQRHVAEPPAAPSTRSQRRVPPALDAVVLRALAKNPADRFPDVATFFEALEGALAVKAPTGEQPAAATTPTSETLAAELVAVKAPRSRMAIYAGAGALALLVGVGVGVMALGGRTAKRPAAASSAAAATGAPVAPVAIIQESPLMQAANRELGTALAGDARSRRLAVEAMAEVGDRSAMPQLITALGDDNPEVRRGAALAAALLGREGDADLRAALDAAAARSGGQVAVDVAAARFKVGEAAAETELRQALEQRDPASRLRAAEALAEAGRVSAPVLRAAIQGAPPTVRRKLRWAALVQLYKLKDAAFAAELAARVGDTDPAARLDAAQTLARGGDDKGRLALSELAAHAPDPIDRVDAAAVLAELDDVGAVKVLLGELADEKPAVRARAATSLGRLAPLLPGKDDLAARLQKLLAEPAPEPRIAAACALLALESARARRVQRTP